MQLNALTDEELLRHAEIEHDRLTASVLETELLRRFALCVDFSGFAKVLDDNNVSDPSELETVFERPDELAGMPIGELSDLLGEHQIEDMPDLQRAFEMQDACLEHDIDTPEELRRQLDRIRTFDGVMNDLVGPLKTLTELAPA